MNIGQVFGVSLYWKPRLVMAPPLSSSGTLRVAFMVMTCGARDDKVDIMTIVNFMYYTHGPLNIGIMIAIQYYLPRILKVNLFRIIVF